MSSAPARTNGLRLLNSALSVSSLRLVGQGVALVSGLLVASLFGATTGTDDYYTALILPGALANLIINTLTNLFAPIYLKHVHDDPAQGAKILSSLLSVVLAALALALLICLIAVPFTTGIRGLASEDATARALLFGLALAATCPLVGISRLLSVFSETQRHYNVPALTSLLSTALFVVMLLLTLRWDIYSLLIASVVSAALEALILSVYASLRLGLRFQPVFSLHPAVRDMLRASLAPALTFLALFFIPTVDRLMASSLDAGSLTAFHYGERPAIALETLVLTGPLLILYYHWANVHAAQGAPALLQRVPDTISLLCFVFLPLGVGGALLSTPIISLLFGRGAFTAIETSATVFAILWFSQVFNFLIVALVRLMLIFWLTRVQLILSVSIMGLNTALNLALIGRLGLLGIVLSTLFSRILIAAGAFALLKHYHPAIAYASIVRGLGKTLVASAFMIAAVTLAQQAFGAVLEQPDHPVAQIGALVVVTVLGAAAYGATAYAIRQPDLRLLLRIVGQTRCGFLLRRLGLITQ